MTIVLSMNDGDNNLPKFGLIQSLAVMGKFFLKMN